jgi:hypothetical protein
VYNISSEIGWLSAVYAIGFFGFDQKTEIKNQTKIGRFL